MSIDTSPEALAELRMYAGGYSAPDVIKALIDALEDARAALEPFARNAHAKSLSEALGHIERKHLLAALAALEGKPAP